MNVDLDPDIQDRLYTWQGAQKARKRKPSEVSFRAIFDQALRLWFAQQDVEIENPAAPDSDWSAEEHELANALVEWLRDPEPREQPYREAITGILKGYRKRKLREAGIGAAPNSAAKEGGPSSDGQTDPVSKRPRRLRHGG